MFHIVAYRDIDTGSVSLEVSEERPKAGFVITNRTRYQLGSLSEHPEHDELKRFATELVPSIDTIFGEPLGGAAQATLGTFPKRPTPETVLQYVHNLVTEIAGSVRRLNDKARLVPLST